MRKILLPYFLFFALACVCNMRMYADEIVGNASQLEAIALSGSDYNGETITLTADIDLSSIVKWTPIGSTTPFKGTFNGGCHIIKGLRMFNGTDGVGLFGHVAQEGKINQVGIAGDQIMAGGKNRVGALVGVCDGDITECWSMAEIDAAGSIVGGLVGELTSNGSLTDCYNAGIIMNGTDTVGGIVGKNNGGSLTRVYYTGYAKNGNAIVGADFSGKYKDCYYDRKLYYQMPGAAGITGMDDTQKMFGIFEGKPAWKINANLYPILNQFKDHLAAQLSVASVIIDTKETAPVNHANELTVDFDLNTESSSINWACRNDDDTEWIKINTTNGHVSVTRPCSEIDVIIDGKKSGYNRAIYVRPIKLRDFDRSWFQGIVPQDTFCYGVDTLLYDNVKSDTAKYGWKYGQYHYMLTRDIVNAPGDTTRLDTLIEDAVGKEAYNTFMNGCHLNTTAPGTYVIKRWVHDERCVQEWVCSYLYEGSKEDGKFIYTVLPEFKAGKIEFVEAAKQQRDTLILMPGKSVKVSVDNVEKAIGGGGPIYYQWRENKTPFGDALGSDASKTAWDLKNHEITQAGKYEYTRYAKDSMDCAVDEDKHIAEGKSIFLVWDRFDPGKINLVDKKFCSVDDAKAHTIDATPASGGSGSIDHDPSHYSYQWYYSENGGPMTAITGATDEDLSLASLSLTAGNNYTFMRRAEDDSRFTNINADSCKTVNEQYFEILVDFKAGKIENKKDTFIYEGTPIVATAADAGAASGGGGTITYQWEVNGNAISGENGLALTGYNLTAAGTYVFKRVAADEEDCDQTKNYADGERVYVIFDKFNPGNVIGDDMTYCTVDEAKEQHIINATYPTGGSGTYLYQWYLLEGSTEKAISGATSRTLKLGDYELGLKAGHSYTFIRRAEDDTRFTVLSSDDCKTAKKQTVYIMESLDPGAIKNGKLEKVCVPYDATGDYKITVKVSEATAAEGEEDLEYMWYRNPGGAIVGNTKTLNYTFPLSEIQLGTTYTYTREVRNPGCSWSTSEGEATQYYGQEMFAEKTVTVCDEDMPYAMEWTSADGKTEKHTFREATDTWTVTDESFDCPHDTLIRINVVKVPEISIDKFASFCQQSGMITLNFEQSEKLSDEFHITYSTDLAKYMGTTDTIGKIEYPGTIVLRNVPSIGTGDNYLMLSIGYSDGSGCFSHAQRMDLYVSLGGYVYSKYDRVLFVDNNPDNGLVTGKKLKFESYQWYKNGVAQEGQTGQYYHEEGKLLSGTYYVMLTDTEGHQYRSCDVIMPAETTNAAPQRSAVYPVPVGTGEPLTIEGFGTTQIVSFSGECVSHAQSVDGKVVIAAPRMAGMYYVQVTNENGEVEMHKLIVK